MALDGPYTIEDLVALTGGRSRGVRRDSDWLSRVSVKRGKDAKPGISRLIGIDPGTRFVGWGVIECDARSRTLTLVDCGCISPGAALPVKERLRGIFESLEEILQRTQPHFAALEETFAGVNMKSA